MGEAAAVHRSVEQRIADGRAARRRTPRSTVAEYEPAPDRPDPISMLEQQALTREPDLVPIRYGRMMASPFAFYRGAASIMAFDLATTATSGLEVQACGDAHLSNFGLFASPERTLLFDINDFDETHPGPWEWDVKRLGASFAIAARERGFTAKQRTRIVKNVASTYREKMAEFASMGELDVWYQKVDATELDQFMKTYVSSAIQRRADTVIAKARANDSLRALSKLSRVVDGRRRIISDPPLVVPIDELLPAVDSHDLTEALDATLQRYRTTLQPDRQHLLERFSLVDVARKVVGVGSVGTQAWIALLVGRDDGDALFLQVKEAQPSVLERYTRPCVHHNQGARVVAGQHLMQAASDIFLGWDSNQSLDGTTRDFYVRQLRDGKGSANPETMTLDAMGAYARLCGWTLARAHARTGDRIAIAAYLGTGRVFDNALVAFAETYADQNERDHAALVDAVKTGGMVAETGV